MASLKLKQTYKELVLDKIHDKVYSITPKFVDIRRWNLPYIDLVGNSTKVKAKVIEINNVDIEQKYSIALLILREERKDSVHLITLSIPEFNKCLGLEWLYPL